MSLPIFEIAIMGRAVWNLHSLNNEGTVGNVSEPRTVVLADGSKSDGISGEMLKHIHAQNVWLIAEDKSVFCQSCQTLQPQKADKSSALDDVSKKAPSARRAQVIMDAALQGCALCDLHGFLRTKEAIPRSSVVEFGWAVALRNEYHRDVHIHARHVVEGRADTEQQEGAAAAQMVYHRPTRSGTYALVSVFCPWRIGLNEVNYHYVEGVDRESRYRLGLDAYKAVFARTDGAMTSTRLPHVEGITGSVVISTRNFPAPIASPLRDDYQNTLKELQKVTAGIELAEFDSVQRLFGILEEVKSRPLYSLKIAPTPKKGKG